MVTVIEFGLITSFRGQGDLHGYAGCNEFSGEYHINGSNLNITNISKGNKGCTGEDERNAVEGHFLNALEAVATFNQEADQLYLLDASGTILVEYVSR
jgi:heat shock protein HslJ